MRTRSASPSWAGAEGRASGQNLCHCGTVQSSMNAGEVQGCAQSEVSDAVAMGFGDSLDHAVQAEAPQVVRHSSLRDQVGRLPGEHGKLLSQIPVCEAAGKQTKPDQQMPQRQHAQIGGA